ncbi:hypothetical protein K491DRAFT_779943 [Lophiostoma macrostomum CBS 122681]|uniref:Tim44-like domain-containing protein n=1 Tax=Lophiostoma macrostomum CBS 122681 TaxID=1314788 RepID=A0A6A6T4Y7_9PLEO|nr:hypothetical protein K491DRAFT_779943 [Lophiostoma macrostomum CBS 122681]
MSTPLRIARPLHRKCTIAPCTALRPFSSSAPRQRRSKDQLAGGKTKEPGQKAPKTIEDEARANAGGQELPEDTGLLSETFVRGSAPKLSSYGDRWRYEWKWMKTRFRDWWSIQYYVWYMKKTGFVFRLKPEYSRAKVRDDGEEYYTKIYEALASKDRTNLDKFCVSGIIDHLKERWAARPADVTMTWKLLDRSQDLSSKLPWLNTGKLSARIVSNRMGHLPISGASDRKTPSAVRQVVLRIASRQVLTVEREIDGKGKGSKAEKLAKLAWRPEGANEQAEDEFDWAIERHPKDVVEYVVMQRRMLRGNEEDWKVWGFTEPTTMESMREAERFEKESRAYSASQLGIA